MQLRKEESRVVGAIRTGRAMIDDKRARGRHMSEALLFFGACSALVFGVRGNDAIAGGSTRSFKWTDMDPGRLAVDAYKKERAFVITYGLANKPRFPKD